jgi:hypothetical protein
METSNRLHTLEERAEQAERKATTARRQAKADLEKTLASSRALAEAQAAKLRESAQASHGKLSSWWADQQRAWNTNVEKMRKTIDARKTQREAKDAEEHAEQAEADASFAIDYAYSAIGEAEYAVLDAILARQTADEAMASAGRTR